MGWSNDAITTLVVPTGAMTGQPRTIIGANRADNSIPDELLAFYPDPNGIVTANLQYPFTDDSLYYYEALLSYPAVARGWVFTGTVQEQGRTDWSSGQTWERWGDNGQTSNIVFGKNGGGGSSQFVLTNGGGLLYVGAGAVSLTPGGPAVNTAGVVTIATAAGKAVTVAAGGVLSLDAASQVWAKKPIVASDPSGNAEVWHTLTLGAGWTGTFKYRITPTNAVKIRATCTPGTKADGTNIGTLPVGYRPLVALDVPMTANAIVAGGQSPHINVGTNGVMTCWGITTATGVQITGEVELDYS